MRTTLARHWAVGIVIPANDEEEHIDSCLESILASCRDAGLSDYRIVVVADSCTDSTAAHARTALGDTGEVIECAVRSAGTARRRGVEAVLKHFHGHPAHRIWLANTDADTTVPRDWLAVQMQMAESGMSGVAGIVRLNDNDSPAAHEVYRKTYLTAADGTHPHVHGANLSVRADAYLDAGGWPHLALAEDHCLWQRLKRRGWRLHSPVDCVVITSGRMRGRAPGGFADTLRRSVEKTHADA